MPKFHTPTSAVALLSVTSLVFASISAHAAPKYTLTDLGLPFSTVGTSAPKALNNHGDVVGSAHKILDYTNHPFLYRNGVMRDLGLPNATEGTATDINNNGQVVLNLLVSGSRHTYLWDNGVKTDIGSFGSANISGESINDRGQIVGTSNSLPFSYKNGTLVNLTTVPGYQGIPQAINNMGQIVGGIPLAGNQYHAFLFSQGVETDFGTFGGDYSFASAVNDLGHVVGSSFLNSNHGHAFFADATSTTDLGTFGGQYSAAHGINNHDVVVGYSDSLEGAHLGFVYQNGVMQNLNNLIDPKLALTITEADDINDNGQIVATAAYNTNLLPQTVLLTPNVTPTAIPAAPAYLTVKAISGFEIDLMWAPVPDASDYTILRSSTPGGPYVPVGTTDYSTNYHDTDLHVTTPYYYRVAAHNSFGTGMPSVEATATTKAGKPDQAVMLHPYAIGPTESTVNLDWYAQDIPSATTYLVFRGTTPGGYHTYIGSTPIAQYLDTGLQSNTSYYYIVVAANSYGQGPKSNELKQTTKSVIPLEITGLYAFSYRQLEIGLEWSPAVGATAYQIYRGTTQGGLHTWIGTSTTPSYKDVHVQSGIRYYYIVRASNATTQGPKSNEASGMTTDLPYAPYNLTATPVGKTQINLTWDAALGAMTYVIYRSTSSGTGRVIIGNTTGLSFHDTNLQSGTRYYYVVVAGNSYGWTKTLEVSAIATELPGAPIDLTAAPMANSQVNLTWTAGPNSKTYAIYRSTTPGTGRVMIGNTTGTSFIDTHAQPATHYYYVVVAGNAFGYTKSAEISFFTPNLSRPALR